ncbi:ZN668 protein, partial [Chordeiles acutipennis]|nr:ZN668 protein [Chordeiles acutipennis]
GERPYACGRCGKGFGGASGLRKHERTHGKKEGEGGDEAVATTIGHDLGGQHGHGMATTIGHEVATTIDHEVATTIDHDLGGQHGHGMATNVDHEVATGVGHDLGGHH